MPEFAVRDIRPNPFRHIERYPINREKVAALRESLRTTGFWDNVVARQGENGHPELAYGHHRQVALKEEFGSDHKVNLIIRLLDDEHMLQIMARENMEEWGTSAAIEQETVRAVVEAYAEGKIGLAKPEGRTDLRYAPSFVAGEHKRVTAEFPYTAQTVAKFLGWMQPSGKAQAKVGYALGALELIEKKILSEIDFENLSTKDAQAVVQETRKAQVGDEAAARLAEKEQKPEKAIQHRKTAKKKAAAAGKAVSRGIKKGEGYRNAPKLAAKAVEKEQGQGPPPHVTTFARRLAANIGKILAPEDDRTAKLDALVPHWNHPDFSVTERNNLIVTLRTLSVRAETYAAQLAGETSKKQLPRGDR